jgi:hypothetical protein
MIFSFSLWEFLPSKYSTEAIFVIECCLGTLNIVLINQQLTCLIYEVDGVIFILMMTHIFLELIQ